MSASDMEGPRACAKAELAEMIALVDAEMRAGKSQSLLTDYPLVYRDANLENVRIIKAGGKLASVVPFIVREVALGNSRFSIGIISPTATAPEHRKKGYGSACLRSCVEKMTLEGVDLSALWTDVRTFPFYEKADYQAVRPQGWVYPCRREDANLFPKGDFEVVRYGPERREHIEEIQAMHERDVYGVLRARGEYPVLFSLPKMETLIALERGRAAGYLLVSRAVNKPGLLEAGGKTPAVETLVNHALAELEDGATLSAHANLTPSVLGDAVDRRMRDRRQPGAGGNMMIRINDARGFMGKISSRLVARNAGAARRFSIAISGTKERMSFEFSRGTLTLGDEFIEPHLEMTLREFTGVVFGAHAERPAPMSAALEELFPFYFPLFMLDHS
ncbi:MAG: GNAT family N-acetyltransferase [Planctomycetota bacterium]